jgi:hypothetical protein
MYISSILAGGYPQLVITRSLGPYRSPYNTPQRTLREELSLSIHNQTLPAEELPEHQTVLHLQPLVSKPNSPTDIWNLPDQ